jgi:DNA-binding Lrp family transcriptional regulator
VKAYVLITTKPGTSEDVVEFIKKIPGVISADSVWGRYDVIAIIEAPNMEKLSEIVYKNIAQNANILHTETSVTLR